ncbi:PBSX family phage portal protein [Rivihabitans pingtungensis]|uniref:PBSX family phage portal protein n=2 Tax=Rivihabitans pingtungensis TaxID=1054498 RepID=A0A318KQV8_9NEIS|nr:PBSX family phage portal protein [Rivihabitans pingtungensis]
MVDMTAEKTEDGSFEVFSFGDPEPVLSARGLLDYIECVPLQKWYDPPISLDGLARVARSAVWHESPMILKRNILAGMFKPNKIMDRQTFARFCWEFMVFGNAYLVPQKNLLGGTLKLQCPLTKYTRRGIERGQYWYVPRWNEEIELTQVFHLMEPDLNQDVYGVPQYMSALQSALLNESATLFRRRYYENGSHAGFILYMTDATHNSDDIKDIKMSLRNSKGVGNFKNLFVYAPNGKKDGIQLIPIAEIAAKDEFVGIKNMSRDDLLAAHRVPPQLIGVIPNNTGGFGDAEKAARILAINEIGPLTQRLMEVNDWLGEEVMTFGEYPLAALAAAAPA